MCQNAANSFFERLENRPFAAVSLSEQYQKSCLESTSLFPFFFKTSRKLTSGFSRSVKCLPHVDKVKLESAKVPLPHPRDRILMLPKGTFCSQTKVCSCLHKCRSAFRQRQIQASIKFALSKDDVISCGQQCPFLTLGEVSLGVGNSGCLKFAVFDGFRKPRRLAESGFNSLVYRTLSYCFYAL